VVDGDQDGVGAEELAVVGDGDDERVAAVVGVGVIEAEGFVGVESQGCGRTGVAPVDGGGPGVSGVRVGEGAAGDEGGGFVDGGVGAGVYDRGAPEATGSAGGASGGAGSGAGGISGVGGV